MKNNYPTLKKTAKKMNVPEKYIRDKINFLFPEKGPQDKTFHLPDIKIPKVCEVFCIGISNVKNRCGKFYQYSFVVNVYQCEFHKIHTVPNTFNIQDLQAKRDELIHKL